MQGWIKLHRNIMQSETFSKLNAIQQLITIYIILNANHEDGVWYDKYKDIEVPIERGQLITSRKKIADEWFKGDKEVTEQKVRTTLKKLEKIGFLTSKSTNSYTLLEVLNYNVYQKKDSETNHVSNQVSTKSQPSLNQVLTTNKNDKNDKEKDYTSKIKDLLTGSVFEKIEGFNGLNKQYWDAIRETRKNNKIAHSVIFKNMEKWTKYHPKVIEYALKTHADSHKGYKEEYTLGIMRNTSPEEAEDKLNRLAGYSEQKPPSKPKKSAAQLKQEEMIRKAREGR